MVEIHAEVAKIEYFSSIACREIVDVLVTQLTPFDPLPQNRCYFQDLDGAWRTGRTVERRASRGEPFFVTIPNKTTVMVEERDLYVRWSGDGGQPMDVLKRHGHETPFFSQRRWPLVRILTRQRAAARGATGVLSSGIDLREHQIDVARRVLQDPVQRYLLADEVGLGKTIEAGIILRQFLLDQPRGRVVVLAPQHLVRQWQKELRVRFHVEDFPWATVSVLAHGRDLPPADFAVIDEAHRLTNAVFGSLVDQAAYRQLAAWAHTTPRLLLLSATPAASDQDAFLGMLHLLDPEVYALDQREAFRQRVRERERIAYLFLNLQPDLPASVLEESLGQVENLFPSDKTVTELLSLLRQTLLNGNLQRRTSLLSDLRAHLGETYKLHRRMLRNRRGVLADSLTRGRTLGAELLVDDTASALAWEGFEEWRQLLHASVQTGEISSRTGIELLAAHLESALAAPQFWCLALERRLRRQPTPDFASGAVDVLTSPLLPGEEATLEHILDMLQDAPYLAADTIARAVRGTSAKTVVFTSLPGHAELLFQHLARVTGTGRVCLADSSAAIERFSGDSDCRILVADRQSEEGINLQMADMLIHADLPLNPNRLEQRIGRLDRYGRGKPITSRIVTSSAWPATVREYLKLLIDGLGIFSQSIAGLQFLIESLAPEMNLALMQGSESVNELAADLPDRVQEERERLDMLDQLDAIDQDEGEELTTIVDDLYDTEALSFELDFTRWVGEALKFQLDYPARDELRVSFSERHTLVPWERVQGQFGLWLDRPATFSRRIARESGLHLLRLGEPFVDAVAEYLDWDDRGRSFALWRADYTWTGPDTMAFELRFIVRGNFGVAHELAAQHELDDRALRRRLDELLAPMTCTIYLDHAGQPISREIMDRLIRPYLSADHGGIDFNLSPERMWAFDKIIPGAAWEYACDTVLRVADTRLRESAKLIERLCVADLRAQTRLERRLSQLRSRRNSGAKDVSEADLDLETRLAAALLEGVRDPDIRLDSVGMKLLSNRNPFEFDDPESP